MSRRNISGLVLLLGLSIFGLTACSSSTDVNQQVAQVLATNSVGTANGSIQEYRLGTGDEVKLIVYGEDDLSGSYLVSSTGVIALPLIGSIKAAGQTIKEFEDAVKARLSTGYLKDPRVSAQVANYRPFFILGEVQKPGSYPYVNGMNVMTAVALAGGYSYRADKGDIHVVHATDPTKKSVSISEDSEVLPGDILSVPERFF